MYNTCTQSSALQPASYKDMHNCTVLFMYTKCRLYLTPYINDKLQWHITINVVFTLAIQLTRILSIPF